MPTLTRYSLAVDEDIEKPTNQPTKETNKPTLTFHSSVKRAQTRNAESGEVAHVQIYVNSGEDEERENERGEEVGRMVVRVSSGQSAGLGLSGHAGRRDGDTAW